MNLAGLRYWQWIVIGLALGSIIGWAWMGTPADLPRTGDPLEFNAWVNATKPMKAQNPNATDRVRNITVYAPETDPSGNAVYPVTYETVAMDKDGKPAFVPWLINAKTPYFDARTRTEHPTIMAYLDKNEMPFTNRAGNTRFLPVGYGAATGFIAIGLLWPTMIKLLVQAGFATPPPPREKKVKQPKGSSKTTVENYGTDKAGARGITGADIGNLDALNDDMEKRLAVGLSSGEGRPGVAGAAGEPVSLFMTGGGSSGAPDPTAAAVPTDPGKPKDYKGEWYPVARPIVKKEGEA